MSGSFTVEFVVMLLVPAAIDRQQLRLYDLLDRTGPKSVYAAVEADRSLGGLDVDAWVVSATDPLDRTAMASTQVFQRAVTIHVIVSAATLAEVRDGIADRLKTVPGLRVTEYVPDDVAGYPAALIFPPTNTDYRDDLS
jgi:hypothetical protein